MELKTEFGIQSVPFDHQTEIGYMFEEFIELWTFALPH